VNPDRRSHVLGAAIIAALILLGGGIGIGYAVAPSGHGRPGPQRFERGDGNRPGQRFGPIGQAPGAQRPGGGQRPGPGQRPGASSVAPVAPSGSSTG
jgi:hypothetical protein